MYQEIKQIPFAFCIFQEPSDNVSALGIILFPTGATKAIKMGTITEMKLHFKNSLYDENEFTGTAFSLSL